MTKRAILLAAAALAIAGGASAQNPKIDGVGLEMLNTYKDLQRFGAENVAGAEQFVRQAEARGSASRVNVYVTLADGYGVDALAPYGVEVLSQAGSMAIVNIDLSDVEAMADDAAVKYVGFPRTREVMMNKARAMTNVDAVQAGTGLPKAFDGSGVICGIVDTGLDPGNVNFLEDDLDTYRVQRFYEFTSSNGTFKEYAGDAVWGVTTDNAEQTHGTHVAGIMTGSYMGNGGTVAEVNDANTAVNVSHTYMPFYGMAPGSTIAMAGLRTLEDDNITMGVQKIIEYAEQVDMPAVVNVSLGSIIGPHDMSDNVAAYFAQLGKRAIICVAAGNDGDTDKSIAYKFTTAEPTVRTMIQFANGSQGMTSVTNSNSHNLTITLSAVNGSGASSWSVTLPKQAGTYTYANSSYNNSNYITSAAFDAAFNNRSFVRATVYTTSTGRYAVSLAYSLTATGSGTRLGLVVTGNAGDTVDISSLQSLKSQNMAGWTKGDGAASVSSMACGDNVICVGSFNSRLYYGTLGGQVMRYSGNATYDVGKISPFSSYGTMVNGSTRPHITGPGCTVVSSFNYFYTKNKDSNWKNNRQAKMTYGYDYYWSTDQGTSMASPAVAGIVALWLQAEPTLTVADALDVMKNSAITDDLYLSSGPAAQLGWGRIDALAGIKKVLAHDYSGIGKVFTDSGKGILVTNQGNVYEAYAADARAISVELYDLNGRRVSTVNAKGDTAKLDLNALPAGVYVLRARAGNAVHSQKIVR